MRTSRGIIERPWTERRDSLKARSGGPAFPTVVQLAVASVVDGSVLTGALVPALRAEGAPNPSPPRADRIDHQAEPSSSEIRARIDAAAPDPALEARLRRIAWQRTVIVLALTVWADVRLDGRTPGRAVAGLRLVQSDGTALTVSQAVLRECAPAVGGLATDAALRLLIPDDRLVRRLVRMAASFVALPLVLADSERRTLADRLAGTRLAA